MPARRLHNIQNRNSFATGEEIKLLSMAIQQLANNLHTVFVHNKLIYRAKCRICGTDFKVIDEGNRALFYSENGFLNDQCIDDQKTRDSFEFPPATTIRLGMTVA